MADPKSQSMEIDFEQDASSLAVPPTDTVGAQGGNKTPPPPTFSGTEGSSVHHGSSESDDPFSIRSVAHTTSTSGSESTIHQSRLTKVALFDCDLIELGEHSPDFVKGMFHKWLNARGKRFEDMSAVAVTSSWNDFIPLWNAKRIPRIIEKHKALRERYGRTPPSKRPYQEVDDSTSHQSYASAYDYSSFPKRKAISYEHSHNYEPDPEYPGSRSYVAPTYYGSRDTRATSRGSTYASSSFGERGYAPHDSGYRHYCSISDLDSSVESLKRWVRPKIQDVYDWQSHAESKMRDYSSSLKLNQVQLDDLRKENQDLKSKLIDFQKKFQGEQDRVAQLGKALDALHKT